MNMRSFKGMVPLGVPSIGRFLHDCRGLWPWPFLRFAADPPSGGNLGPASLLGWALFLALALSSSEGVAQPAPPIAGQPNYVIQQLLYQNITTLTTTTLKSAAGVVHNVCINTPAATGTIVMYDNTSASGTKLGSITMTSTTQGCFAYDIVFNNGLTVVTAVAAGDLTFTWR